MMGGLSELRELSADSPGADMGAFSPGLEESRCYEVEYSPALLSELDKVAEVLKSLTPAQVKAAIDELIPLLAQFDKPFKVSTKRLLFDYLRLGGVQVDDAAQPTEEDRQAAVKALEPVVSKHRICVVDLRKFLEYVKEVVYDDRRDGRLLVRVRSPWTDDEITLSLPLPPWTRKSADGNDRSVLPAAFKKLAIIGMKLAPDVNPSLLAAALLARLVRPEDAARPIIADAFVELLSKYQPLDEASREHPWCTPNRATMYVPAWIIADLDRKYAQRLGNHYKLIRYAKKIGVLRDKTRKTIGSALIWVYEVDVHKLAELLERPPDMICTPSSGILWEELRAPDQQ